MSDVTTPMFDTSIKASIMKNSNVGSVQSVSRRAMLKAWTLGCAGTFLTACRSTSDGDTLHPAAAKLEKYHGLLHNEDCTDIFAGQEFPDNGAGDTIDRYVDVLAGAGVNVLMVNTNSRRTNYRSAVWESFWDGYDPSASNDQPFLAEVPQERRERFRKMVHNMWTVHCQGIDYPARVIQRCRKHGIRPWISLRMNDVHNSKNLKHPFHGAIFRRPELFMKGHKGYFANGMDYAHAEVREHYLALIRETLERYDIDGLELDFLREPFLFSVGQEGEGRQLLTAWIKSIRELADQTARRRGHAIRLGVRTPSCPETALGLGLDVPLWARESLVDLVVVAPRWATIEFAMPLRQWRELVGDKVTLAGGMEVLFRAHPSSTARRVTLEEATGAAVAIRSEGADAVYLFNYFQKGWPINTYQRLLNSFGSLQELLKHPRRHAVTYRDVTLPGEAYRAPLPAGGKQLTFTLPLGPIPASAWKMDVCIEIATKSNSTPTLAINGVSGNIRERKVMAEHARLLTYEVPVSALNGKGDDTITINASDENLIKINSVEVALFTQN